MSPSSRPDNGHHRLQAWPLVGVFAFSAVWLLTRTRRREDRTREEAWIEVVARSYDISIEEARARVARENTRMDEIRRALGEG
jgi:hypothetical protein